MHNKEEKTRDYLLRFPKLLDDTVPFGKDDKDNVQVKTCGTIPIFAFLIKNHIDLALASDQIDMEKQANLGSPIFLPQKPSCEAGYGVDEPCHRRLTNKGFSAIVPPCLMTREAYEGVTSMAILPKCSTKWRAKTCI